MPTTFVTGGTGFLGSYACTRLLADTDHDLVLMARAPDRAAFIARLWSSWQLHLDADAFAHALRRVHFVAGDLHAPGLGLSDRDRSAMTGRVDRVLHIAASLNRKSAKACLNTNLRGTLSVLQLARHLHDHGGLRRYTHVSTVAVSGERDREDVHEDDAIDWNRSDYDPYGRTKKFCEHMARELLPDVDKAFLRPSIVMGDPRFPQTTQFDMVRAFCAIADLPAIPLDPAVRLDIVDAAWVGRAIATLHAADTLDHDIYHLSAGRSSRTAGDIAQALVARTGRTARFAPWLGTAFDLSVRAANRAPRGTTAAAIGALLKVFWPYIVYDTVFVNDRAVEAVGVAPTPFPAYCGPLYDWSKQVGFRYPAVDLPAGFADPGGPAWD